MIGLWTAAPRTRDDPDTGTPDMCNHDHHGGAPSGTQGARPELVRDPVCGMEIDPLEAAEQATHAGVTYSFCSSGCAGKFRDEPERYLAPERHDAPHRAASSPASKSTTRKWTCPMHPEVVGDGPGPCPICGMALEPMTPSM